MTPEKDIMHYARMAEQAYKDKYTEAGETAPAMFVVIDTTDEYCMVTGDAIPLSASQLMFRCHKREGRVSTEYLRGGECNVARVLGLRDTEEMRRVEGEQKRHEDMGLYIELPEELRHYSRDFFKIKISNLDELIEECDGIGWGDEWCQNVLEILGNVVNDKRFVDVDRNEVQISLDYYCQPSVFEDDEYDFASFSFSHFEVQKDFPNNERGSSCIYVCYKYWGMVPYSHDEVYGTPGDDNSNE